MSDLGFMGGIRAWINSGVGRTVVGIAVVVLVVIAAFVLYQSSKPNAPDIAAGLYPADIICTDKECGHTATGRYAYNQKFPVACPACGKETAVRSLKCPRCDEVVPSPPGKMRLKCPKCGQRIDIVN